MRQIQELCRRASARARASSWYAAPRAAATAVAFDFAWTALVNQLSIR